MNNKLKEIDYYLVTYPRSGKNWIQWYLDHNTNIKYLATHYIKIKDKNIWDTDESLNVLKEAIQKPQKNISIVRDPVSCLTSINIMERFNHMEQRYYQYIDHYEYILENNKFLFNFDDVKNNTKQIASFLCNDSDKVLNIKKENFNDYEKYHLSVNPKQHLITSKNNKDYELALDTVKKWNLKKHNELYLEAKNLCVRF